MKSLYVLLLAIAISTVSCRTKDGEPGPAGESGLNKQGTVSGTIRYFDDNENEAFAPFNFEYFESFEENRFYYNDDFSQIPYELSFSRRALKDVNNYFDIEATGYYNMNGEVESPNYSRMDFSFFTLINNQLYRFYRNTSELEITNFSLDRTTGRLIYDFSGDVYYDNGTTATITGKVDVILTLSNTDLNISQPAFEFPAF